MKREATNLIALILERLEEIIGSEIGIWHRLVALLDDLLVVFFLVLLVLDIQNALCDLTGGSARYTIQH